jgi:hypothetical protein
MIILDLIFFNQKVLTREYFAKNPVKEGQIRLGYGEYTDIEAEAFQGLQNVKNMYVYIFH